MLISDGRRPQPTSKKNRRLVLAGASQRGEPRHEIPYDPPSFSLAAIVTRVGGAQKKCLPEKMPPGKIASWKKCLPII